MASISRTMALLVGALVLSRPATAQTAAPAAAPRSVPQPSGDPLLDALVTEALEHNPDLGTLRESLVAAQARPDQARSLADPMLSVVYTNDGWSPSLGTQPMTTFAFMGSQELPFAGKRALRGDIAAREADQVALQLERARLRVVADLKRAYYGLVLGHQLLELVREQEQVWKEIEGVARARYAVGQGVQPDVLRVQVEVTRVQQLATEQQAETEIRVAELNRLLGRLATSPVETTARLALHPIEEGLDAAFERLRCVSPEIKGAAVGQERAGLLVALASKEFKPDFRVQAGYMNRGGLDPMWQAGVGVSLPLYRKRLSSGQAEAEALVQASARLAESVGLQLRFRTQQRLAQLEATQKISRLYDRGIIPQDRMSVDAALANYQTGKVPFIAVLEALTTLYNDRATQLGLLANHERIRASLEEASLEETSSMAPAAEPAMARGGGGLSLAGASADGGVGSGRSMR